MRKTSVGSLMSIFLEFFPVFRNGTRQNETLSCVSIEDAGRVEDPISMLRPCKTIVDGRSLVLVNQLSMCLVEELQSHINR